MNILSFNIRSLPANYVNLLKEPYIYDYDFILLQETWVKQNEFNCYEIDGFKSQFTGGSHWKGNGLANYFKNDFYIQQSIYAEKFQICKLSSETLEIDILNIYYKKGQENEFLSYLNEFINCNKICFVFGDLNTDFLSESNDNVILWLQEHDFVQIIQNATHIQGGLLDHVWIPRNLVSKVRIDIKSLFYSDHDCIIFSFDP